MAQAAQYQHAHAISDDEDTDQSESVDAEEGGEPEQSQGDSEQAEGESDQEVIDVNDDSDGPDVPADVVSNSSAPPPVANLSVLERLRI